MIIRFRYCFVNFPYLCKIKLSNLVTKELLVCVHDSYQKKWQTENYLWWAYRIFLKVPISVYGEYTFPPSPPILPHPSPQLIVK